MGGVALRPELIQVKDRWAEGSYGHPVTGSPAPLRRALPGPLRRSERTLAEQSPDEDEPVPLPNPSTVRRPRSQEKRRSFLGWSLAIAAVLASLPFWVYFAFSLPPDTACVGCHEMRASVSGWRESGSAEQHGRCGDCHFDPGPAGFWQKNRTALVGLRAHWGRQNGRPLTPRPEPLFYEPGREPGFYSSVPNHRCFQCKQTPGHNPLEMQMIHRVFIDFPADQPCKDCHNHDMRNGQRFYEKILPAKGANLLQVSGAALPGR